MHHALSCINNMSGIIVVIIMMMHPFIKAFADNCYTILRRRRRRRQEAGGGGSRRQEAGEGGGGVGSLERERELRLERRVGGGGWVGGLRVGLDWALD
jgi:hypothetical protein